MISEPHLGLPTPSAAQLKIVKGRYDYFHYGCDGVDDRGWGCGYRTLQTLCSWICQQMFTGSEKVPSLKTIQLALVEMGDKSPEFIGSREWIGTVEVAYCIGKFYEVPCKIVHVRNLDELRKHVTTIEKHFDEYGSPVMMGGDKDCGSKTILGAACSLDNHNEDSLLILDPHYSEVNYSRQDLQSKGYIKWREISSFDELSFYNLCFPLMKSKNQNYTDDK